jgi:hypothetical protein
MKNVDSIHLALNVNQWWPLVDMAMNSGTA